MDQRSLLDKILRRHENEDVTTRALEADGVLNDERIMRKLAEIKLRLVDQVSVPHNGTDDRDRTDKRLCDALRTIRAMESSWAADVANGILRAQRENNQPQEKEK